MTTGACFVVFAVLSAAVVTRQQVVFKTPENGAVHSPNSTIVIASYSDVFIDVQCIITDDELAPTQTRQWSVSLSNDTILPSPLDPGHTSYSGEDGVLRVFSAFIREHAQSDVLAFHCQTRNSLSAVIKIALHPALFFDGMFPGTIASADDLQPLCVERLPQLPTSSVGVHSGSSEDGVSYSYCVVGTARGTFRSSSIRDGLTGSQSMLRLQPSSDEEVVQWVTEDSTAIQLSCQITGVGRVLPTVFFLKNGVRITSNGSPSDNGVYIIETSSLSHRILVVESRRGNEGVFQCVGQVGEDGSTTLTTSTYINMQYLDEPVITISSDTRWSPDTTIILGQSDTPSEVILNCSVEAHPIPTLTWFRDDRITFQEVEGHQALTGYRETAYSELRVSVSDLKGDVEFMCIASVAGHQKNDSMNISVYSKVVFTKHPNETESPHNILTCEVRSTPVSRIEWIRIQNGVDSEQMNTSDAMIHTEQDGCTVRSTLQLAPINDSTITGYYCKGNNNFFQDESNVMEISDSIPTRPEVNISETTPTSVVVEWTASSSLLVLSHYDVTLYLQMKEESLQTVSALQTSHVISGLRPYTSYAVKVEAVDVAGNNASSELVHFQTQEAAPEGAPGNVIAEAYDTERIWLSWSPPNTSLHNGIIRKYSIVYHPIAQPNNTSIFNTDVASSAGVLLRMPLGPGTSYNFSVAANTIKIGPLSAGVIQQTYPEPPVFYSGPPTTISGVDATESTIPVQLPPVNYTHFSHFWVVVVPLDSSSRAGQSASVEELEIPSASSSNTQPNEPYIATEMSSSSYLQSRRFFVLGDEDGTRSLNDFPDLYCNKPLSPGTTYSAFVRGFVPSISPQNGSRSRREDISNRQYVVFSSSDLLPVTATLSPEDEGSSGSSSEINTLVYIGIGVGGLLVLVLILVILVIRRKIKMMSRKALDSDDERKYESSRSDSNNPPNSSNGTLPRGLTVTGEGVKQEEHIYEDPLYLKACEAHTETEAPIYKVPRPVSDGNVADSSTDDSGYEVITPTAKAKKPNRANRAQEMSLIRHELGIQLNGASSLNSTPPSVAHGEYELMQHPCPVDLETEPCLATTHFGSPAGYLQPVAVLKRHEAPAGYSVVTATVLRESQPASTSPPTAGCSAVEYANHTAISGDNINGAVKREARPTRGPEEYVLMKPVVPE